MKYKHGKNIKRERRKKLTLANQMWWRGLTAKAASTSQPFQFAVLFCSEFSPSHVLLKLLAVFLLLCCLLSDRPAHDKKTHAWGNKASACLTAVCLIFPYSMIVCVLWPKCFSPLLDIKSLSDRIRIHGICLEYVLILIYLREVAITCLVFTMSSVW